MADNDQDQAGTVTATDITNDKRFALQRVYIKDSSFEAPDSPECFKQAYSPRVDFSISVSNSKVDEENFIFEVVLKLTAEVKQDDKTMYLAEVQQGGIFEVRGVEDDAQLLQVLSVTCPTILFPYGREALDSLVIKGSFPALMIAPVSFEAIFTQAQKQREEQAAAAGTDGKESH